MTSPVKLSRERWEMLWRGLAEMQRLPGTFYEPATVRLSKSFERSGITFLPAEYVLGESTLDEQRKRAAAAVGAANKMVGWGF